MKHNLPVRWRANSLAALAVVLSKVNSIAFVVWLLRNLADLTDTLLFIQPRRHHAGLPFAGKESQCLA